MLMLNILQNRADVERDFLTFCYWRPPRWFPNSHGFESEDSYKTAPEYRSLWAQDAVNGRAPGLLRPNPRSGPGNKSVSGSPWLLDKDDRSSVFHLRTRQDLLCLFRLSLSESWIFVGSICHINDGKHFV